MTTERQFYEYTRGLIASSLRVDPRWSEDRLAISFPKKNERGFDIEVSYDPVVMALEIRTDRGYHDHFHAREAARAVRRNGTCAQPPRRRANAKPG